MENTETPTRGSGENHKTDPSMVIGSNKPLHRFIRGEPRSLGIVVMMCGFAELLMGIQLARDPSENSSSIYVPFWQGALFLVCGNLSLYTGAHPSKKMVTVCFAMYLVTLVGVIVSLSTRIVYIHAVSFRHYSHYWIPLDEQEWRIFRIAQLTSIEAVLCVSSLCVSALLIFLSVMARLALKSTNTHTQVVIQQVLSSLSGPTTST